MLPVMRVMKFFFVGIIRWLVPKLGSTMLQQRPLLEAICLVQILLDIVKIKFN